MQIESSLGEKGIYILDCVDQKHIDLICDLENRLDLIDQSKYIRSGFTISDDELSTYLTTHIDAAIMLYINKSNKNISEYIARDSYALSSWKLGIALPPHIDTIKYPDKETHTPRSAINALVYLTDDYEGGEITFPELDMVIKPKAGSVVVFDADLMHGVNAVKSGMRKTLESHLYSIYSEDIEEVKSFGWRTL